MEDAADEDVGHRADVVRILADELADAELAAVPGLGQLADPGGAAGEIGHPFAELLAGRVAVAQAFDDRVGGELAALEREPHAGRIDRIDESPRVADEHPAVAGGACRWRTSTLSRHRGRRLFRCLRAAGPSRGNRRLRRRRFRRACRRRAEEIVGVAHDADADDVVRERDVPEPGAVRERAEADGHHAVVDHVAARAAEVAPDGGLAKFRVRVGGGRSGRRAGRPGRWRRR